MDRFNKCYQEFNELLKIGKFKNALKLVKTYDDILRVSWGLVMQQDPLYDFPYMLKLISFKP